MAQVRTLQEQADARKWWHSINLGNGVVTKGYKSPAIMKAEAEIAFKYGVNGRTVLDIGAWSGGFSLEAERRGAKKVTAMDYYAWHRKGREPFDFARKVLRSRVRAVSMDVYDITPKFGKFDVVLFFGVLYHLKHPHLVLELLAPIVKEMLVIETYVELALSSVPFPALRLIPGTELNNDPTNWCGPNIAWLESALKLVGFSSVEITPHPLVGDRVFVHARR